MQFFQAGYSSYNPEAGQNRRKIASGLPLL